MSNGRGHMEAATVTRNASHPICGRVRGQWPNITVSDRPTAFEVLVTGSWLDLDALLLDAKSPGFTGEQQGLSRTTCGFTLEEDEYVFPMESAGT